MSTNVKRRGPAPGGLPPATEAGRPDGGAGGADPRRRAMLAAAYEAFIEHGVSGATTDEIARRARVSKREIYRLFGNKEGLFAEIVRERGTAMQRALALAPPGTLDAALEALERFGREFLALLTAPTAIAVYRLAIAEAGRLPALGRQLDAQGRGAVLSALGRWMKQARARAVLPVSDPERAAGMFLTLLNGSLPLRLALGAIPTPGPAQLARRAALATEAFRTLWLR